MLHHSKHGAWQEDHFWMVGEVAGLQNLLSVTLVEPSISSSSAFLQLVKVGNSTVWATFMVGTASQITLYSNPSIGVFLFANPFIK